VGPLRHTSSPRRQENSTPKRENARNVTGVRGRSVREAKRPPVQSRAEGHPGYCLSYTEVLVNFLPFGSVPLTVTVRLLPSAETTMRPLMVTLPSFLLLNANV